MDHSSGAAHMREALRLLSAEGLVEATAQRGFRVTSATEDDLSDLQLIRIEIETIALTRAIELGDVDWEGHVIAANKNIKVGALRFTSHSASFIAFERGHFADAGLDVEFEFSKPRNLLPWRLPRAMSNTL